MRIINTAKDNPAILDTLGRLAFYSGMDNLTLFEIKDGLSELMDSKRWATYRFEMELQAALLEMSFNGMHVDQPARKNMTREFTKTVTNLTSLLNEMLEAIGYFDYYTRMAVHEFSVQTDIDYDSLPYTWDEWKACSIQWRREVKVIAGDDLVPYHKALKLGNTFNPNSPAQKLKLFYHFFGSPGNSVSEPYFYSPPWLKTYGIKEHKGRKSDGTYGPTTDRSAMEKIIKASSKGNAHASYWAATFAHICLDIADLTKSLGFLKCKLDNGMFRASFGAVTETGRLNSRQNAMGFGSNAQNITPKLRHIFIAPKGYKLAAPDFGQIESRIVAAICFQLFGATNYLAAVESGDLHSLSASMVWPDLPWPENFTVAWAKKNGAFPKEVLKEAKRIASEPFYRGKSRRDLSKTLGHGTSYLGKPRQMSIQSHVDVKLVEHYQQVFFDVFPEIAQWHDWVAEQLQTTGEITTMLGRSRRFFDRPNDDATLRKAVAYEPQSVAGDYTNQALLKIVKATKGIGRVSKLPAKVFLQKHDEIGFRFLEKDEEEVCAIVQDLMEQELTITSLSGESRQWVVPVEMETGFNLGFQSKKNPDGLGHPDSTRVRTESEHWTNWKI
jgi:hypothetical protein